MTLLLRVRLRLFWWGQHPDLQRFCAQIGAQVLYPLNHNFHPLTYRHHDEIRKIRIIQGGIERLRQRCHLMLAPGRCS